MKRRWKWAVAGALATAAVAISVTLAGATTHRVAGVQAFTVNVDSKNTAPGQNESFLAYYPSVTRVHAGDSVTFHYVGPGEPHTVTFGNLVDKAVSAYRSLTPAQQQSDNPPASFVAADAALPYLLPQGPGDAVQSAANPCYQQTGPVGTSTCPLSQHEQPAFNGSYAYYNSGWLKSNQKWTMQLSSSTPTGTYRFMCLLHREFMSGAIKVVPPTTAVLSPAAQFAAGQKVLAGGEKVLVGPAELLEKGLPPIPHVTLPDQPAVLAGSGNPASNTSGEIDEFGAQTVHVPVGGSVTWWIVGDHSITFDSNNTDNDIQAVAPDGTTHLNPKALAPAGGPGEPPPPKSIPTKGLHFKLVASSTWNGHGFHSSGVFVNSSPPAYIEGYKLKFTRAGTYHYICVVHDNMKGTVVVG